MNLTDTHKHLIEVISNLIPVVSYGSTVKQYLCSNVFVLTPSSPEPCQPTGLTVHGSCNSETVVLNWSVVKGALVYEVTATGNLGYIMSFQTNETTIETELPCGQLFTFTVKAQDDQCDSAVSLPETFKTGMSLTVFFCLVKCTVGLSWFSSSPFPQAPASLRTYRATHAVRTIWAQSAGARATGQSPTWLLQRERTAMSTCAPQTPQAAHGMTCTVGTCTPFMSSPMTNCAAACQATVLQYGWVKKLLHVHSNTLYTRATQFS